MDNDQTDPAKQWRLRRDASRKRRDEKIGTWQENVSKLTKTPDSRTNSTEVTVNKDWPLTKAKKAQLYSQTPEVRLTPKRGMEMFAPAVTAFGAELNDTIKSTQIGTTIGEVLTDVINASGIGAVLVTCEKRYVEKQIPKYDPVIAAMTGSTETIPVTQVSDIKYLATRISPADLLVPTDFTGSNYDDAHWLGHDGRMPWAQAKNAFSLTEEDKEKVLGADGRANNTLTSLNTDTNKFRDTEVVSYSQLFYWRHFYHEEETSFSALQRIVLVDGLEEPKINEPYTAQVRTPDGKLAGVLTNPIRVQTLTYIPDESLPPSDMSAARFQINELEDSRNDMVQQRRHSRPLRGGDVNRISANQRAKIDAGNIQDFIWTNGPGERAIWEVARASFPQEKYDFDRVISDHIAEIVTVGTNQGSALSTGEHSAREVGIVEKNFQRRVGQEQDQVQAFFLGIVEVLAGHLAVYGQFAIPDALGPMRQQMANAFTYSTRVDATVRMDADERIEKLTRGLNLTAQSGYVNPKPIISEIWELLGVDPATVVIDPQPKAPEPVKVSISSAEDIINPVMLATLFATNQAPTPEQLAAAVALLTSAMQGAVPVVPPSEPSDQPPGGPETPGISHPSWEAAPRIERRAEDGGA